MTNRLEMPGHELILWHRERCGKSEEAHAVQKDDLAGGKMPSGYFGVNAAWWAIMILPYNLNSAMKRLVLSDPGIPAPDGRQGRRGSWSHRRLKALRFNLIQIPGRVIVHARQLIIRLVRDHPATRLLVEARRVILSLVLPAT
ncbi:MAG: transposase [Armatimonadetes bacterium]|nr:transposase [Armatimonadota bacterium]